MHENRDCPFTSTSNCSIIEAVLRGKNRVCLWLVGPVEILPLSVVSPSNYIINVVRSITVLKGSSTIIVSPAFTGAWPIDGVIGTVDLPILVISRNRYCIRVGRDKVGSSVTRSAIEAMIYIYFILRK